MSAYVRSVKSQCEGTAGRPLRARRTRAEGGYARRIALPLFAAHFVLAALDARLGWTHVPPALQAMYFGLVVSGLFFTVGRC